MTASPLELFLQQNPLPQGPAQPPQQPAAAPLPPWYAPGGLGARVRPYAEQVAELARYYNPLPHAGAPVQAAAELTIPSYGANERQGASEAFQGGQWGRGAALTGLATLTTGLDMLPEVGPVLAKGAAKLGGATIAAVLPAAARRVESSAASKTAKESVEVGAANVTPPASAPTPAASRETLSDLATRYPPPGTPVETLRDPKDPSKGTYLAKSESPEAAEMMKQRARIRREMEKGYTPFYDPAKRADVDPGYYPTDVNTLEQSVGAKAATREKYETQAMAPKALENLATAYEKGLTMPDSDRWYHMKQLEDDFVAELGPVKGREAFRDKFAGSMAATTGGADPEANFLMAMYGNYLRENKLPYPKAGHELASPIGGRYVTGNLAQHQRFFDQLGGSFGPENPKRSNFQYNKLGYGDRATMDEQMMTSGWGLQSPPPGNYGSFELPVHHLAGAYGVDPRGFQDVSWAGAKSLKDPRYKRGYPMIQTVNDAIERTSKLTGQLPEDVVRRAIILSQRPVY